MKDKFIKVLAQGDTTTMHKDKALLVAGKMILSANADIHAEGVLLKAAGDDTKLKIDARASADAVAKTKVEDEGTSDDNLQAAYKHAIAKITEKLPHDEVAWLDLAVELSSDAEATHICAKPSNAHASHGTAPHTVDAIVNTDKNRRYMLAKITKGAPDDESSYIEVEAVKSTEKHVMFLLPVAYRNVVLWIVLTPFNAFGKGNPTDPFKCDPMS